ncbi:MAG: hypothetical protein DRP09_09855 [Candidatus Thorarchaeota archaeon]|nr:MAG: hypothetical protein DRP09_09855 [Candidatus Thorarchaeota archaeon]
MSGSIGGEVIVYLSSTKNVNWNIEGLVDSVATINWNIITALYSNQDYIYEKDIDGIVIALNQRGVVQGLEVGPISPASMAVSVTKGRGLFENSTIEAGGETVNISPADPTYDRKDLILVDRSGNISVAEGEPASSPKPPMYECMIWDDCEDLNNEGATWTAVHNATVGNTTTSKYGINAIYVKGAADDNPGIGLEFASAKDWSDYKSFEIWIAPLNDDSTPATDETARIYIYDDIYEWIAFDVTLSSTPDEYVFKRCQLNSSGVGDAPDATGGTFDSSKVKRVEILLQTATDNIDFAFDQIKLYRDDKIIIGQVIVQSGASSIGSNDIRDERKMIYGNKYKSNLYQVNMDDGSCKVFEDEGSLNEEDWVEVGNPMKQWGG